MTPAEIRAKELHFESAEQVQVTICEILQEIAAQLAEHNQREAEAQSFTRAGDWQTTHR